MKKLTVALAVLIAAMLAPPPVWAGPVTLYNDTPSPLPANLPSQGFECCQVDEWGQGVQLATGGQFTNLTLNVLMSDWATESTYETVGMSAGFNVSMTAKLYNLNPDGSVGSVIAMDTATQLIPWRPESNDCGGDPTAYTGADGTCDHGSLSTASFDFGSVDTGTGAFVWTVQYDTFSGGYNPTGVHTGADSLNGALSGVASPSIGSDTTPGDLYLYGSTCAPYDDCSGGPGVLRMDPGWTGFDPAATITADASAVPEPASLLLLGTGLIGAGLKFRRRKAN